jgi:hypothetical protein
VCRFCDQYKTFFFYLAWILWRAVGTVESIV